MGDNASEPSDNAGSETPLPSSSRKRTTSGKDLQEIRAAAKAAVHNSGSSTPALSGRENEAMGEQSEDGTREGNNAGTQKFIPRDELIAYLQRGLLWQEAVHHANEGVSLFNKIGTSELPFPSTDAHCGKIIGTAGLRCRIQAVETAFLLSSTSSKTSAHSAIFDISYEPNIVKATNGQ